MLLPRWLPRLLAGIALAVAEQRKYRVLPNGAPLDSEPFVAEAADWESLRQQVEGHFGPSLWHAPEEDWRLTDASGVEVKSWEDLRSLPGDSPILHVVPSGMLFQWAPRAIGERFPVHVPDLEGVEIETVARHPRIFLIHNLMSADEAIGLIERAGERTGDNALQMSGVGFKTTGPRSVESLRTSASAFDMESEVAKRVLARAFNVTRVAYKEELADGLQILRYQIGQAYIAHRDWFPIGSGTSSQNFNSQVPGGSNRFATVFLYLWSPPSGGYTVFPLAEVDPSLQDSAYVSTGRDRDAASKALRSVRNYYNSTAWEIDLAESCYSKLSVKPVQLGAALFYHQDPMTGELLAHAEHGACPSLTGTKWGANLWIWNAPRHLTNGKAAEPVSTRFVNHEAATLDLAWSTDDGATWVYFGSVTAGNWLSSNTFGGHWWRFTEAGTQNEVRRFIVPLQVQMAEFSSRSEEPRIPQAPSGHGQEL